MKKLFVIITTGILLLLNSPLVFPEEHVFAPEEHCLAYKTVKTMFFFADVDVIGKAVMSQQKCTGKNPEKRRKLKSVFL